MQAYESYSFLPEIGKCLKKRWGYLLPNEVPTTVKNVAGVDFLPRDIVRSDKCDPKCFTERALESMVVYTSVECNRALF